MAAQNNGFRFFMLALLVLAVGAVVLAMARGGGCPVRQTYQAPSMGRVVRPPTPAESLARRAARGRPAYPADVLGDLVPL